MLRVTTTDANDIYTVDDGTPPKPVVFYVHGGAWHVGSKERTAPVCEALAHEGYVVVATSYCLSSVSNEQIGAVLTAVTLLLLTLALTCPTVTSMLVVLVLSLLTLTFLSVLWVCWPREEVRHPAHIADVAKNFRWVVDHIGEHGGDPAQIAVMGHSAGAHLAALLATNTFYLHQAGVDPTAIKACVAISGPYSDRRLAETAVGKQILHNAFGRRKHYYDAFPLYHASPATCPFLLLNAGLDLSLRRHTFDFHYALRQAGVYVKTVYFDQETHWSINHDWSNHNRPVLDVIHAFLQERWACLDQPASG